MLLEGKNAIVTGGSQGIGAATSLELAREGADVCLTYRRHGEEAQAYVRQIREMGREAVAIECDISVSCAGRTGREAGRRGIRPYRHPGK